MDSMFGTKDKGSRSLRRALSGLRGKVGPREVVVAFAILYFVTFAVLTIGRHEAYSSARFDLGNMDQAIWNSSEGRILESTSETGENRSRLANHADFLLLAFVPLYWLYASPYWLLVVQAFVVGLGAVPLFWLARRFMSGAENDWGAWPAALVAIAYLFNPGIQSANTFDFHAQTLAPTLLLFAFYYLLERRLLPFVVFGVLASLCKEEISLIVAMMGLYMLVVERRPKWGIPVFAVGVAYFLFVMQVAIPAFNDGSSSELMSGRYSDVGGSMGGVVTLALTEPVRLISYVFSTEKLLYLLNLLGWGGLIGVLSPAVLLIPLPEVAINLLSDRQQMVNVNYHYSATITPFILLATASAIARVSRIAARLPSVRNLVPSLPMLLASWVLLFGIYVDLTYGPIPIATRYQENPVVMQRMSGQFQQNMDEAVAVIPDDPDVKVSASNWIAPHLVHRETLYLFPVIRDADYVIVDLERASYFTGTDRQLGQRVLERNLVNNPQYSVVYSQPNVVVFEKVSAG